MVHWVAVFEFSRTANVTPLIEYVTDLSVEFITLKGASVPDFSGLGVVQGPLFWFAPVDGPRVNQFFALVADFGQFRSRTVVLEEPLMLDLALRR